MMLISSSYNKKFKKIESNYILVTPQIHPQSNKILTRKCEHLPEHGTERFSKTNVVDGEYRCFAEPLSDSRDLEEITGFTNKVLNMKFTSVKI